MEMRKRLNKETFLNNMPTISDSSIDDVLSSLENWRPFQITEDFDIFIGAIGFEERASACFAEWCASRKILGGTALLLEYSTNCEDNKIRENDFIETASPMGINIRKIVYHKLSIFGEVTAALRELSAKNNILFDISALASFAFYPFLNAVANCVPNSRLTICYSEAKTYFPEFAEWSEFKSRVETLDLFERARLFDQSHFQSDGIENVFESLDFPGLNFGTLPNVLIVTPNFAFERVQRILDFAAENYTIDRSGCEWVFGLPPNREKNGWRHTALLDLFLRPNNNHDACTFDFKDALVTFQNIWLKNRDHRAILIGNLGSKAQHLASFMFLKMHPDVALILSEPKRFLAGKFSTGVGAKWIVTFGPIKDWIDLLRNWNRIIFKW